MPLRDILAVALGVIAVAWYYVCLFAIGNGPMPGNASADAFRGFMSLSMTTIGSSLATFVGMLLGLQQAAETVRHKDPTGQGRASGITTKLQWASAALYVLSLVIALLFWYRNGDKTDPAVSNLGKTILGLLGGALAIVLNLSPPKQS
jgi:hypothetical protein